MLQDRLELTRERTAGTQELDVPTETLSSSQHWALALRKAKEVLSCVSKVQPAVQGSGYSPLLTADEAAPGEPWSDLGSQVQHQSDTERVKGLEHTICKEKLKEPGLSVWL